MTHTCDGTLPGCFQCAAIARRLAGVRAVLTADDRLDDVGRARIWSRVDETLALQASHRRVGWRWPAAIASAAAVAAAIALVARMRGVADDGRVLSAPPDVTVTASLGPHARAAIVGPAQLEVTSSIGEMTTVRLDTGTFYAQFEGGPGRALRVVAPGAIVDVVGTLFAIETNARTSCVSVAHGRVRVTTSVAVTFVGAGERWCTGDPSPARIEPRIEDALARHELVLAAREPAAPTPSRPPGSTRATPAAPDAPPPTARSSVDSPADRPVVTRQPAPSAPAAPEPPTTNPNPTAVTSTPAKDAPTGAIYDPPTPTIGSAPNRPVTSLRGTATGGVVGTKRSTDSTPSPLPTDDRSTDTASTDTRPTDTRPAEPAPERPRTAEELYRDAEAALARHDTPGADRALARLLADDPHSPLADQALYERARIAYQRHAWLEARRHLDALAAIASTPLAEPGRYLACRIAVEARDSEATRCLAEYRAAYPKSAHDLDVLGLLVQLVHADAGCAGARPFIAELARSYPKTALARGWRARCPEAP